MTEPSKPYKIKTNDFVFFIDDKHNEIAGADLIRTSANSFNCIIDHQSVNAVLVESDIPNKKFKLAIEGEMFSVEIKDTLDQMLEKMGFGLAGNKKLTNIKAPMPGLVLDIAVIEGQQVSQGDNILILEAMKMENSLAISVNAVIKKILVSKGQVVERGQVLVELE